MNLSRFTIIGVLFTCTIFVSIGLTPLFSFATLGLIILLTQTVITKNDLLMASLFFLVAAESTLQAYLSLSGVPYDIELPQVRLILLFATTYFISGLRFNFKLPIEKIGKLNARLLILLSISAAIQVLLQKFGIYIYIPEFLLAMKDSGTTLNADRIDFLTNINLLQYRASVFYAEPSYYGLVVSSLLAIGLLLETSNVAKLKLFLFALIGVSIAQTFYGIFAVAALYLANLAPLAIKQFKNISRMNIQLFFGLVFIFGSLISAGYFFNERLQGFINLTDASGVTRLINPFSVLSSTWINLSYFGYPVYRIYEMLSEHSLIQYYSDPPLHNGLINIFINNGLMAPFLLFLLLKRTKSMYLFIFSCLVFMQNGAFGNWDKAYLIALACVIANTIKHTNTAKIKKSGNRFVQ